MSRYIVLVPAAGVGQRFGAPCPKQYVDLAGQTVLQHTVNRLLSIPEIDLLLIMVSPEDAYIDNVYPLAKLPERVHILRCGGVSRALTVKNGIAAARNQFAVQDDDWILVHDAARCCVKPESVQSLISAVRDDVVGGLLALPVSDTLKRANEQGRVSQTVERAGMWQAQTPQMFRCGMLYQALEAADLTRVTDEASAVEGQGFAPLLITGNVQNLKITTPQDLALARFFLFEEQAI